jgi:CO/xanthine dehydrogenase FAD-binding subunit
MFITWELARLPHGAGVWEVQEVHLAFGGVAPKAITAPQTEALLKGKPWTEETLRAALGALAQDVCISPDAPGAGTQQEEKKGNSASCSADRTGYLVPLQAAW